MGLPKVVAGVALVDVLLKASAAALTVALGVKAVKAIRKRNA
jgi:hypothetical protein